jgi:FMN phosphatase YigB (HAD superfamily)
MRISSILFDAVGVLYERPLTGMALQAMLEQHGLTPRHPKVVGDFMRAATFDACLGRISQDDYYTALLRVHGLDERSIPAGREALRFDASRVEIEPTIIPTLSRLHAAGLRLGAVANSLYSAEEEVSWLERVGIPSELWTVYLTSCEMGAIAPDPKVMTPALQALAGTEFAPTETLIISHDPAVLMYGIDAGIPSAGYRVEGVPGMYGLIQHFGQLAVLVAN